MPYSKLLGRLHGGSKATGSRGDEDSCSRPWLSIFSFVWAQSTHIVPLVLPSVCELGLCGILSIAMSPDCLPDALPYHADNLWPVLSDLLLKDWGSSGLFFFRQFGCVLGWPRNNIGQSETVEFRHLLILLGGALAIRQTALMKQLPEVVGWVGVRISSLCRADPWIVADQQDKEIWRNGIGETIEMGILAWRSVLATLTSPFCWRSGASKSCLRA
jgi:hypothetical protein